MRCQSLLLLGTSSVVLGRVAPALPVVTQAPSIEEYDLRRRQASMDLASLGQVLLTGVPPSILALALTNVPAVSRLLWSEFLDDHTPAWFTALPSDIQQYLSGEFGPSTAASISASTTPASFSASATSSASTTSSGPSASSSALNNQAQISDSNRHTGIPLWAKIAIGVLVPVLVIGLFVLLVLCCIRRRRDKKRQRRSIPPVEQHAPLRGGYLSQPNSRHQTPRSSHHQSSSDDFRTPIGGTSYENIPPAAVAGAGIRHSRHDSNHSLGSRHSHPIPEPMYDQHHPRHHPGGNGIAGAIPLPPRSPRRSRDLGQDATLHETSPITPHSSNERRISRLNPAYGDGNEAMNHSTNPYTHGQGIYRGGSNQYSQHHSQLQFQYKPYSADLYQTHRGGDPFSDPSPSRHVGFAGAEAGAGAGGRQTQTQVGDEWPLRAINESGYRKPLPINSRARRNSWSRGDDI